MIQVTVQDLLALPMFAQVLHTSLQHSRAVPYRAISQISEVCRLANLTVVRCFQTSLIALYSSRCV
jgi:hypothetical protein